MKIQVLQALFRSSTIVFYCEDFPLSVTLIELATDCEVTIEIDLGYWD